MSNTTTNTRRGRRRISILVVIAALAMTFTFAAPAGASVVDTDNVKITGSGLDFGDGGLLFGAPTQNGTLTWKAGTTKSATLTGTLFINQAGECGRIRLVGYDWWGTKLDTVNGGTVCASGGGTSTWSVDKTIMHTSLDHVKVVLQVQNTNGGYSKIGAETRYINFDIDPVKLTGSDLDFGEDGLFLGSPVNSGDLDWGFSGGEVNARLTGRLYIDRAGVCGRMKLVGYDENNYILDTVYGGTVCGWGSGVKNWTVDKTISAPHLDHVLVVLQVQNSNGTYSTVDSEFEYV